jgi:hypothetical protein
MKVIKQEESMPLSGKEMIKLFEKKGYEIVKG